MLPAPPRPFPLPRGTRAQAGAPNPQTMLATPHREIRRLYTAQGGALLHHEAKEPGQDGGDGPGWVPRVWVEIRDGKTQPAKQGPTQQSTHTHHDHVHA